jgi:hypothetical protein
VVGDGDCRGTLVVGLTRIALAALAVLTPLAAHGAPNSGGWDVARWGMSPDQLSAAAHGAVRPLDDSQPGKEALKGRRTLGPFKVEVQFDFDEDGLSQIDFNLVGGGDCGDVADYLGKTYGEPYDSRDHGAYRVTTWRDVAGGNTIDFAVKRDDDALCMLYFDPLTPAEG